MREPYEGALVSAKGNWHDDYKIFWNGISFVSGEGFKFSDTNWGVYMLA